MSDKIRLISQSAAQGLASTGQKAFVNDTPTPNRYFTYPEIANLNGIGTPSSDFIMSPSENSLTGLLMYHSSTGTWPVDKSIKPFPR